VSAGSCIYKPQERARLQAAGREAQAGCPSEGPCPVLMALSSLASCTMGQNSSVFEATRARGLC
jgi:uncharacterized OsmC-like protein